MYVLNTCSVTKRADREARQIIRRFRRRTPDAYIIVIGCYAQLAPEEIGSLDGVDLVLGSGEKFKIFEHAGDFLKNPASQIRVSHIEDVTNFAAAFSSEGDDRTRAFLKVQDGCDFGCSFCTIPLARGNSRSASIEDVISQARLIASSGYREIVLTGVNVGDYGSDDGSRLHTLLRSLEEIDGIDRIRISSIEPNLLTFDMVDYMVASFKMCNHFHIPLQSGSDDVLKRMRRRYLTDDYRRLVDHIRSRDLGAGIGVDVIVGFPGETQQHFEETYNFIEALPVSYLHVFTYSEREQTPAASLDGIVEPRERFKRNELLRILARKKRYAFASQFIGKIVEVLFEEKMENGSIYGLTRNYLRVSVPNRDASPNQIQKVIIDEVLDNHCRGRVLKAVCEPGFTIIPSSISTSKSILV